MTVTRIVIACAAACLAVTALTVAALVHATHTDAGYAARCTAAGGVPVQPRAGAVCVDPHALITVHGRTP